MTSADASAKDSPSLDTQTPLLVFHKPKGLVVTRHDDLQRKTVYDALPPWVQLEGWLAVGRLDRDSRGLLLFVKDGRLQDALSRPGSCIKVYDVWVRGRVTDEHLEAIRQGITTSVGVLSAVKIERRGGAGPLSRLEVWLDEGKNRHIRRMFGALSDPVHKTPLKVMELERKAFGPLKLDVPSGQWRFLTPTEIEALLDAVGARALLPALEKTQTQPAPASSPAASLTQENDISSFFFTVCQVGAEAMLKQEMTLQRPELRLAYSRPGFLTFKHPGPLSPEATLNSVFARAWGISRGKAETASQILERAAALGPRPMRLHVFPREALRPEERPEHPEELPAPQLEAQLRSLAPEGLFAVESKALEGDIVLDVIVDAPNSYWMGHHVHGSEHSAYPGGIPPVEIPEFLPSRAYYKLEEARLWFDLPFKVGDLAVEIGAAPGGAVLAMLRQGVSVIGIDPGSMDPRVLEFSGPGGARLTHRPVVSGQIRREELPDRVEWLLIDANLAPQVALHTAHRLADRLRSSLLGVVFTLKLNDIHQVVHIPRFLRRIRAMGVTDPRGIQLPSNRQEMCACGLTVLGLRRIRSGKQA